MSSELQADALPKVLIALMKGVVYREDDAALWGSLGTLQGRVYDYVSVIGLRLIVDDGEGYAYLQQRTASDESGIGADLATLVPRRPLGYGVSLLLALLRKRLAESDVKSSDARLIVSRDEIVELMRLFMPDASNEARLTDRLDKHIAQAIELGFLRRLQGHDDEFEVRRILKAFVDAQWLHDFDQRLMSYRAQLNDATV
jgi:hypothetical protein